MLFKFVPKIACAGALLVLFTSTPHSYAQPLTAASKGYVCNNDICDNARRAYARKKARAACSMARAFERVTRRLTVLKRVHAEQTRRKQLCINNNPRRPQSCNWRDNIISNLENKITVMQNRLDQLTAQIKLQCNASIPNPANPNPNDCEQMEASKYCTPGNAAAALASIQKRCADLTKEKNDANLTCKPIVCIKPAQISYIDSQFPELSALASEVPTCTLPTPTPTVQATIAPQATATTTPASTTPTPDPTNTSTPTATPTATLTPSNGCTERSTPSGLPGEQCNEIRKAGKEAILLCCIAIDVD